MTGGNGNGYGGEPASGPNVLTLSSGGYGGQAQAPLPPVFAPDPEPDGLTLRDYLSIIWRRKWIILIVVMVATASAYYFSARQPKLYTSTATMIYEGEFQMTQALTGTGYADPYARDTVLNSVNDLLHSPNLVQRTAELLKKQGYTMSVAVEAAPKGSSSDSLSTASIVSVTANGTDPKLVAASANAATQAFVDWRTDRVLAQLDETMRLVKIRMAGFKEKARKSTDYLLLAQRLGDLKILASTSTGGFRVLTPATAPTVPYAPNPKRSGLIGLLLGLVAGLCIAFLLELFDIRVRRPDEIAQILRQPILGRVPRISRKLLGESALVTLKHSDGHVAEAFRMVRTNLEFMTVDGEIRSMAVTSSMKGEGKSVTIANLAVTMAMAGKKIIVVDGDLRRPRMHSYFGLTNDAGVSTVVTGQDTLSSALQPVELQPGPDAANGSDFDTWAKGADAKSRLYVLTSGPIPPNPGEIVAARRFEAILQELTTEADLVLVDTPAMLAVGDTSAIASRVDGLVYLVDMQVIKKPQLLTAADQLRRLPVKMLGTVVRMQSKSGSRYYYYSPYHYYGYTYKADGERATPRRRRTDQQKQPVG